MRKSGQLTIFVVIGILFVVVIGVFFYVNSTSDDGIGGNLGPDEKIVNDYVLDCMESVCEEALYEVQAQGGYFEVPEKFEDYGDGVFLPYYFYDGEEYFPEISTIEEEISKAVDSKVVKCVDSGDFGIRSVSYSSVKTEVRIKDDEVLFIVDMPLLIESEGKSSKIEMKENLISISSRIKGMNAIAKKYIEVLNEDSSYCVNCLSEVTIENEIYIDVLGLDFAISAVIISEDITAGEGNFSYYIFLNKFDEEAISKAYSLVGASKE